MIDASADKQGLTISATGTIRLRLHAKQMTPNKITEKEWSLPGLQVSVISDARSSAPNQQKMESTSSTPI